MSVETTSPVGMKHVLKQALRRAGVNRLRVAAVRLRWERNLLAAMPARRPRKSGRVLCYHSIGQPRTGVNDVTPERFREQIRLALRQGFRFVKASEIAQTGGEPDQLAITFDDGLKSVAAAAAPILSEFGIPWTMFVVTDFCDQVGPWEREMALDWNEVGRLAEAGAEIGSHSVTHPNFSRLNAEQAADQLTRSRQLISERLGVTVESFAIPFGQSGDWSAEAGRAAQAAGYRYIYAQAEETRPPGTVARTFVTHYDDQRLFRALLRGAYDRWEEWT